MTKRMCSISGCPGVVHCRGWCNGHYRRWQRHGDPEGGRHRYVFNEHFFDDIDSEGKAYWLGFITADGWVKSGRDANGWRCNQVCLKLKSSDAPHLEKLRADLSADNPVLFVPQSDKGHPAAQISLSSVHMVQALGQLGVTPRKSLIVDPWDGPAELMRHYWRGMVDGDGTLVRHPGPRTKWHIRLLGTRSVADAFRLWAGPICGSAAKIYPKGKIWMWTVGGVAAPQALAREFYSDATVFLDRKRDLACQLMAAPILHRSRCSRHISDSRSSTP